MLKDIAAFINNSQEGKKGKNSTFCWVLNDERKPMYIYKIE